MIAIVGDISPRLLEYVASQSPKPFSTPTYRKKSNARIRKALLLHGIADADFPPASLVAIVSTIDEGIAAIATAITSAELARSARNTGTRWLLVAAATRNGHVTAPALQQKLSTFRVALRRPGFTSATSKLPAGTARPNPPP